MEKIIIDREYITLGQLLKIANIIQSGGYAIIFLQDTGVKVNQETEQRRGRKLYDNDIIEIEGYGQFKIIKSEEIECI
jgi:S4 domain protein YaaA